MACKALRLVGRKEEHPLPRVCAACLGTFWTPPQSNRWKLKTSHTPRRTGRVVPESAGLAAIADVERCGQESGNISSDSVCEEPHAQDCDPLEGDGGLSGTDGDGSLDDFEEPHYIGFARKDTSLTSLSTLATIVTTATMLLAVCVLFALRSWEGSQTWKTTTMTQQCPTTLGQRPWQHQIRPFFHFVRPQYPWHNNLHIDECWVHAIAYCRAHKDQRCNQIRQARAGRKFG